MRVSTFTPDPFPLDGDLELIAPFWADVDTTGTGTVFYRQTADPGILQRVGNEIQYAFVDHQDFTPSFVIIATWDAVGYYEANVDKVHYTLWLYTIHYTLYTIAVYPNITRVTKSATNISHICFLKM